MENAHDLMHELVRRTDSGRRLLSIATLSAGGAIIAISVVGIAAALVAGSKTPEFVDVLAALSGAAASAAFLFFKFPIFQEGESDIRRNPSKREHKKPIDA